MTDFAQTLKTDKQAIDADIATYVKHLKATTLEEYPDSALALEAYCQILTRGGKRLRGALVMEGYKMCGGKNAKMILQAARAIEMIHASLLVIDDIQDRSQLRRGGPTAHAILAEHFNDQHLGETLASNAALLGTHAAMMILANLDAPAELCRNVLSIMNRTLVVTIHGQIADPLNMRKKVVTETDVRKVQEWKTATYTILNPLHVGMVLAGADCRVTDGVTPYAQALGQAFQITDDIIGTFNGSSQTGKSPTDDIREGKQTLLTVFALRGAGQPDADFLKKCLGNPKLTAKDFEQCQKIIRQNGALEQAQKTAQDFVQKALKSLPKAGELWSAEGDQFLRGLARSILARTN